MEGISIKMKPCAVLTLDDGTRLEVERIGRGRYTIAWRNSHYAYLQVHEKDNSKELLSHLSNNPHLPKVEELGWFAGNSPYRLFREPLYQPLTAKCKAAWELFKLVKECRDEAQREHSKAHGWNHTRSDATDDARELNQLFEDKIEDATYIPDKLKDAVRSLVYACGSYGAYCIEITKKNCAVDAKGNLILLDPCFDLAEVRAYWAKRSRFVPA
jgi:hypothetical protein